MRRNGIFFGVVIILAGALLLAINLGVLTTRVWNFFWPVVIVLLGAWFLLRPVLMKNQPLDSVLSDVPLEGASRGEITFEHGAGRLQVDGNARAGELFNGTFLGGVTTNVQRGADSVLANLKTPEDLIFAGPWNVGQYGFEWNVGVTPEIPIKLHFKTGASESILDLSSIKASDISVETGASSCELTLPANAGMTYVQIKSGVASMKVHIPSGVAANINVKSGLSGLNIDPTRFNRNGDNYRSSDYETALNKVDISIEMGVGSVDIN